MSPEIQALNNYISILEKTNQQLNLWYNPYSLMVGILTLLIALIAMGVAYALWRYGKEQRDSVKQFFTEQEKIIKKKNEQVQKVEEKLNDLIKEYEKQLKSTTKDKKEIQRIIDELKKEKASISAYMGPVMISGGTSTIRASVFPQSAGCYSSLYGLNRNESMICTQCGKLFSYFRNENNVLYQPISFGDKNVYCPFCGAENILQ